MSTKQLSSKAVRLIIRNPLSQSPLGSMVRHLHILRLSPASVQTLIKTPLRRPLNRPVRWSPPVEHHKYRIGGQLQNRDRPCSYHKGSCPCFNCPRQWPTSPPGKNSNSTDRSASSISLIRADKPSLPVYSTQVSLSTTVSPIQPAQQAKNQDKNRDRNPSENPATSASWRLKQRNLEEYERDRVGKYTQYFQGTTILLISKITKALEPGFFPQFPTSVPSRVE